MIKLRIANRNASEHVARRENFDGSHLFAETTEKKVEGLRGAIREAIGEPLEIYAVYSYGHHFPMFAHIAGKWYENQDGYSMSTARHKNQARPRIGAELIKVSTEELKTLIGC